MIHKILDPGPDIIDHFVSALELLLPEILPKKIAVAVSGGADSMCLCLLLQKWAVSRGIQIIGLTVDHKLRQESTSEADQVQKWLSQRAIPHHILTWNKDKAPKNLQESARKARYELLDRWCKEHKVPYLALAHNQDDQVETIIQRLAHHTGPLGLAGIPDLREMDSLTLIRPLLGLSKAAIRQYLQAEGQPWIEDPSNQNPSYTRVRIRKSSFSQEPALIQRLLNFRRTFSTLRMQLEETAKEFCDQNVEIFPEGYALIEKNIFSSLSPDVRVVVLNAAIQTISGKEYTLGLETIFRLIDKLSSGQKMNVHGCIVMSKKNHILICREAANISHQAHLRPGSITLWDNRYKILCPESLPDDVYVGKLGPLWIQFKDSVRIMQLPEAVRPALPGLWRKETLLSVPVLQYDGCLEDVSGCRLIYFPTLQLFRSRFINN